MPALYIVPNFENLSSNLTIITDNNVLAFNTSDMVTCTMENGFYLLMDSNRDQLMTYKDGYPKWMNRTNFPIFNYDNTSLGFVFITESEGRAILF